jgi:hypothetical protein
MATPRSTSNERFLAFMVWPVNRGVLPKTRHRANPRKYGEASALFPRGGRGPSIGDGLGKGFSSDQSLSMQVAIHWLRADTIFSALFSIGYNHLN